MPINHTAWKKSQDYFEVTRLRRIYKNVYKVVEISTDSSSMGSRKSDNPAVAQAWNHRENFHRYEILGLRSLRTQSFALIAFGHSVQGSESKTWNVIEPCKNLYAQVP